MRKISYVLLLTVAAFSACNNESFKKGKNGLEYKIISDGKGRKIKTGDFMQIHVEQIYNTGKMDSVMNDSRTTTGPSIELMDSSSMPEAYFEVLSQLRKGDSLVLRILTDSAFAKQIESMPPFFKKGHYLTTTVKVLNIFTTRQEADSARTAEMAIAAKRDSVNAIATLAKDDKTLTEYFAKNKINAVKTPLGAYVEIIQPGTGNLIDTSSVVKTFYTGRNMKGIVFDSNTDSTKGPVEPLAVNLTNDPSLGIKVITGWQDCLKMLNKGAKAKFYIPSPLAYGSKAAGPELGPNSILFFDIEIVDVMNRQQAAADRAAQIAASRIKQEKFMDSINKLKKLDTAQRK